MVHLTLRQSILACSVFLFLALCGVIYFSYPIASQQIIKLSQYSALVSILYLYIALLISPLLLLWTEFPYRAALIRARRAIGVSGWGFALIHSLVSFFGQLGGFSGIPFLSSSYILAGVLGLIALCVFTLLALTSFDLAVRRLGRYWKPLHRLTYGATILVVLHALMLGTHFRSFSQIIPILFVFGLMFLVLSESFRFFIWITKIRVVDLRIRAGIFFLLLSISGIGTSLYSHQNNFFSVHPAHTTESTHVSTTPHGNPKYTLLIQSPASVLAGKPIKLQLQIRDFVTQMPLTDKHVTDLFVIDDTLEWFSHTQPKKTPDGFADSLLFPYPGVYYVFATLPEGSEIHTPATATLLVGGPKKKDTIKRAVVSPPIEMVSPTHLSFGSFLSGKEIISFSSRNQSDVPLRVFLFRHGTLDFLSLSPRASDSGFSFSPPRGRSNIRSGSYRIFLEFIRDGQTYVQPFDIELE